MSENNENNIYDCEIKNIEKELNNLLNKKKDNFLKKYKK